MSERIGKDEKKDLENKRNTGVMEHWCFVPCPTALHARLPCPAAADTGLEGTMRSFFPGAVPGGAYIQDFWRQEPEPLCL